MHILEGMTKEDPETDSKGKRCVEFGIYPWIFSRDLLISTNGWLNSDGSSNIAFFPFFVKVVQVQIKFIRPSKVHALLLGIAGRI